MKKAILGVLLCLILSVCVLAFDTVPRTVTIDSLDLYNLRKACDGSDVTINDDVIEYYYSEVKGYIRDDGDTLDYDDPAQPLAIDYSGVNQLYRHTRKSIVGAVGVDSDSINATSYLNDAIRFLTDSTGVDP